MKLYFNQIQPNISWKASSNNNVTIIPKNIKNEIPDNTNITAPWSEDCPVKKYRFNANPIKHYRKQYVNLDSKKNTFSNLSLIGSMDKPGNNIVTQNLTQNNSNNNSYCDDPNNNINSSTITYIQNNSDCKILNSDKFYDENLNKVICTSLNPSALVIKPGTTKLSTEYSSSHRELLYKNNKTFIQNLPSRGLSHFDCTSNCVVYNPSNTKYQTQGPITSSARITSLKYDCIDCPKKSNINNCPPNMSLAECEKLTKVLQSPACYGCINEPTKIRRKRINILR
jgi:hypothetical protein